MGRDWPKKDFWLYQNFLPHAARAATKHVSEVSLDCEKMLPNSMADDRVRGGRRRGQSSLGHRWPMMMMM